MLRLCFVALNAYPAIEPRVQRGFGGIETRSWMLARGVAALPETQVSFLVRHGSPLLQPEYDNVQLILQRDRLYAVRDSLVSRLQRTSHFPGYRLRQPKFSDAFYLPLLAAGKLLRRRSDPRLPQQFLSDLPADVFVTFGVQSHSASVIASAHVTGRPAVLVLGSDSDLDKRYVSGTDFVSVYRDRGDVCRWVLDNADVIVCQTAQQQHWLQERFQREGQVLPNPIDLQEWDFKARQAAHVADMYEQVRYALWVGRADGEHKRPQMLLDVARLCPQVPFMMVMNPRDDVLAAKIHAERPSNVVIFDRVPFMLMPGLFRGACVLVNTSALEGFPNTYLQAMASGVPVASLVVEEEFLATAQGGAAAQGSIERLAELIQAAHRGEPVGFHAAHARASVEERHSLRSSAQQLREIAAGARRK